jgi:hypothetical protein
MKRSRTLALRLALGLAFVLSAAALPTSAQEGKAPIDWQRARTLLQKANQGEKLSEEDAAYLKRARQERAKRRAGRAANQPQREGKATMGVEPLSEMTKPYKGQDAGLYGGGSNVPPAKHLAAAKAATKLIQPLDAAGKPAPDGKIVLVSIGMSNTTQEFNAFIPLCAAQKGLSPNLLIVDCAQGGQEALAWSTAKQRGGDGPTPWDVMHERLKKKGVTPAQVQVAWVKLARAQPAKIGAFPAHARQLADMSAVTIRKLREHCPNLRVAYVSSRIYAGHALGGLNPEPYAYESGFSMRWLIQDQIAGKKGLRLNVPDGEPEAPVVLWGPYLWADGTRTRKDGLVWMREDTADDGTHPTQAGRAKVAAQLLRFFKTDALAKTWFLAK